MGTTIVNGHKETTTTYDDGSTQTKIEPIMQSTKSQPSMTKNTLPRETSSRTPVQTKTKIINGQKETTTVFSDGSTQTKIEPVKDTGNIKRSKPKTQMKKASPTKSASNDRVSTSTQTKIVNGQKHITKTHTITRPDGSVQTKVEKSIEDL